MKKSSLYAIQTSYIMSIEKRLEVDSVYILMYSAAARPELANWRSNPFVWQSNNQKNNFVSLFYESRLQIS